MMQLIKGNLPRGRDLRAAMIRQYSIAVAPVTIFRTKNVKKEIIAESDPSHSRQAQRLGAVERMTELPGSVNVGGQIWSIDTSALLGKGGFASVFAARSANGDSGAVKVVDLSVQSSWATSKLKTEAEALRRAQTHAHIIRFHGQVRQGRFHIFVTEAWGQDLLEEVLQHRGLGDDRSLHVMVQVLEALQWLHERGICHGCAASARVDRGPPKPCGATRPREGYCAPAVISRDAC